MANLDLTFKSFKSIAPKYLQGATAAYTDTELTDFEPWVENRFGDRIHLPLQHVSNKFRISVGDRSYTVALSYHFPELVRNPYVIYTTKGGAVRLISIILKGEEGYDESQATTPPQSSTRNNNSDDESQDHDQ